MKGILRRENLLCRCRAHPVPGSINSSTARGITTSSSSRSGCSQQSARRWQCADHAADDGCGLGTGPCRYAAASAGRPAGPHTASWPAVRVCTVCTASCGGRTCTASLAIILGASAAATAAQHPQSRRHASSTAGPSLTNIQVFLGAGSMRA